MNRLETNDKVPDITAPCVWGGEFRLSAEVRRSPVLLYFYPVNYGMMCTYYIQVMNDFRREFDKAGIKVFHVNPDSVENHRKWMERMSSEYDHISDTEQKICKTFGMVIDAPEGPHVPGQVNRGFALIDVNMILRYVWRAAMPPETRDLRTFIPEMRGILKN